ncbi:MAG: uracil-xanthine permease [Desulfobacterales bacterium]|nr:uracil-xanthine permease [Desulfobacterales bacterium]MCP4162628.1 uracil-xanthine permease [Deltaproteobacteria bacterium]
MEDVSSTEYKFQGKDSLLGAQMLFVAFGALVLVPILTGLNSNVALFTAGLGTLIFQIITKGKVPVFLASSFAFIAPISYGVKTWGIAGTMCGLVAAGILYILLSVLIKLRGSDFLKRYLPPVVTGPVIMVIGLVLAPVAVGMATGKIGGSKLVGDNALIISMAALFTTVIISIFTKGFLKLIPILCGIIAGYVVALFFGAVNFTSVIEAPWFAIPDFTFPVWNSDAIFYIVPVAIAPAIEHFGDVLAIGSITGKDYLKEPGVDKTMLGDGIATSIAAFFGGPPNTTYSEVSGAVALTRAFNPAIMTWAAIFAISLSFVGKVGGFLSTIPTPVMGGIMILLFGMITVIGLNTLVRSGDDLTKPRNLVIVSLILVCGIGGMVLETGSFSIFDISVNNIKLEKIGLAGVIGIVLNLILPKE